jgi:hypothetical protein
MRAVKIWGIIGAILVFAFAVSGFSARGISDGVGQELLRLHRELIEAHKEKDVERLLAAERNDIIQVSRGEVLFPKKSERVQSFSEYLDDVEFQEYRDLIEPIVRVSDDGTLGWLIAQVKIAGTRSGGEGERVRFESVWAWIELYEKREGRWRRIGEVSNLRPGSPKEEQ